MNGQILGDSESHYTNANATRRIEAAHAAAGSQTTRHEVEGRPGYTWGLLSTHGDSIGVFAEDGNEIGTLIPILGRYDAHDSNGITIQRDIRGLNAAALLVIDAYEEDQAQAEADAPDMIRITPSPYMRAVISAVLADDHAELSRLLEGKEQSNPETAGIAESVRSRE